MPRRSEASPRPLRGKQKRRGCFIAALTFRKRSFAIFGTPGEMARKDSHDRLPLLFKPATSRRPRRRAVNAAPTAISHSAASKISLVPPQSG